MDDPLALSARTWNCRRSLLDQDPKNGSKMWLFSKGKYGTHMKKWWWHGKNMEHIWKTYGTNMEDMMMTLKWVSQFWESVVNWNWEGIRSLAPCFSHQSSHAIPNWKLRRKSEGVQADMATKSLERNHHKSLGIAQLFFVFFLLCTVRCRSHTISA